MMKVLLKTDKNKDGAEKVEGENDDENKKGEDNDEEKECSLTSKVEDVRISNFAYS